MDRKLVAQIKAARRVSTPLLVVTSPDQGASMDVLHRELVTRIQDGKEIELATAIVRWDIVSGFVGLNAAGLAMLAQVLGDQDPSSVTTPPDAIALAAKFPGRSDALPNGTVLFVLNAHRFMADATTVQAIWNLRDIYKENRRTLILLCPQITLPSELQQDVMVFNEEMPDDPQLTEIVTGQFTAARLKPAAGVIEQAVDAVRGLNAFTTEQITAMSLTTKGLDFDSLWARKRTAIEQTKGLSVYRGTETFEQIGGLEQIKRFGLALCSGGQRPRLIVTIDEIEKMFSGAGNRGPGDTSGTTQDALGVTLREMEDNDYVGLLSVGPPGTGKTIISKALGNSVEHGTESRIMSATMDYGAMKGSLVGQSESAVRDVFRTIRGVAGKGGALFVATCNKLDSLPPELRRRFRLGIWFFDLPTPEERETIWALNLARYKLDPKQERPDDRDWTGADIRNVCDIAWRLSTTIVKAAFFIVPVAKSDPDSIEALRTMANGKFLSATYPGAYMRDLQRSGVKPATKKGGRQIELDN